MTRPIPTSPRGAGSRLLISFACLSALALTAIGAGLVGAHVVDRQINVIADARVPEIAHAGAMAETASSLMTWTAETALAADPDLLARQTRRLDALTARPGLADAGQARNAALDAGMDDFLAAARQLVDVKRRAVSMDGQAATTLASLFAINAAVQREIQSIGQNAMSAITSGEARAVRAGRTAVETLGRAEVETIVQLFEIRAAAVDTAFLAALAAQPVETPDVRERLADAIAGITARSASLGAIDASLQSRIAGLVAMLTHISPQGDDARQAAGQAARTPDPDQMQAAIAAGDAYLLELIGATRAGIDRGTRAAVQSIAGEIAAFVSTDVGRLERALRLNRQFNTHVIALLEAMQMTDQDAIARLETLRARRMRSLAANAAEMSPRLEPVSAQLGAFTAGPQSVFVLRRNQLDLAAEIAQTTPRVLSAGETLTRLSTAGLRLSLDDVRSSAEVVSDSLRITRIAALSLGFALLLVVGIVGWLVIWRGTIKPLRSLSQATEGLAAGNLSVDTRDTASRPDEFGRMARALAVFRDNVAERDSLQAALKGIAASANQSAWKVARDSQALQKTAGGIRAETELQTDTVRALSDAAQTMSELIDRSAEDAAETGRTAMRAAKNAETTAAAITRSVQSMESIAGKIGIVQEIARKTDLLALNAAVEAARAGDAGKGFAVVAAEVRKLAEHSSAAAMEIGGLSDDTLTLSREAGQRLHDLVPEIVDTSTLVQGISVRAADQRGGVDDIVGSVSALDRGIGASAAAAAQAVSTSGSLADDAETLRAQIARMVPDEHTDPSAASRPVQDNPGAARDRSAPERTRDAVPSAA